MSVPTRLPGPVADRLVDRVLSKAIDSGLLPEGSLPDWAGFREFRQRVRDAFQVPETSVTPLMARLFYGVAWLARPARILVVGSFYGNTLVWLAGPGFGSAPPRYSGHFALGVDTDATAVAGARENFARLGADHRTALRTQDGHTVRDEPFDLVLLDADDPQRRKAVYLSLLATLRPCLAPGALVLAHDICVPVFAEQMARYRQVVRDNDMFASSMSMEIDPCGLELSLVVDHPSALGSDAR
ncbi:MAG TPA: hypothetical protein VFZ32_03570 [Micromonosporaceae bacterium]